MKKRKLLLYLVFIITFFAFNKYSLAATEPGIKFFPSIPGPGMTLGYQDRFDVSVVEIPSTEIKNIKFKIENENIAKITGTEYTSGDALATVKYFSVGKTKLIATLNYNGKTYSASYDLDVIETNNTLEISAKGYTYLPTTLNVGDKLELTATLGYIRGSVVPSDVTNDVTWTSSNTNVATVNNNGFGTAVGIGNTTITAKYVISSSDNKMVTSTYNFSVNNSNVNENPRTGTIAIIFAWIIGISSIGYASWHFKKILKETND